MGTDIKNCSTRHSFSVWKKQKDRKISICLIFVHFITTCLGYCIALTELFTFYAQPEVISLSNEHTHTHFTACLIEAVIFKRGIIKS